MSGLRGKCDLVPRPAAGAESVQWFVAAGDGVRLGLEGLIVFGEQQLPVNPLDPLGQAGRNREQFVDDRLLGMP